MSPGGVYNAVVAIPENEGGRAMQKYDVVVVGAGNGDMVAKPDCKDRRNGKCGKNCDADQLSFHSSSSLQRDIEAELGILPPGRTFRFKALDEIIAEAVIDMNESKESQMDLKTHAAYKLNA